MRKFTDSANNLSFTSERITAVPGMDGRSIAYERVRATATGNVSGYRIGNIAQVLDFKEVLGICSAKKVTSSAVQPVGANSMPQWTHDKTNPANKTLQYLTLATNEVSLSSGEYYEFVIIGTI